MKAGFPRVIAAAALALAAAGCGAGQGEISGRVLYDGAPLPGGRLTFRPADPAHNSVSVEIDEQGNYRAVLPAGEVQVSVDNRELEPPPPSGGPVLPPGLSPEVKKALSAGQPAPAAGGGKKASARYVPIPERYYQMETSKLQFTV